MTMNVIVQLQVEGIHWWESCDIDDVNFLKNPHRHIFHIKAKKRVSHDDRDTEIIVLKRSIEDYLLDTYSGKGKPKRLCFFRGMSCEMIAKELLDKFDLVYCSVLEDNENGAEVYP